jgi:CBS domain-containing protein/nucleotide-binding universal stress UspA family protein
MIVKDCMSRGLITVGPKTGLAEAWDLMRDRHIRHLLVMDGTKLAGIVSDRDIRLTLPSPATSLSAWEVNHLLATLAVSRVMTPSPITIAAERPVSDAIALMLEHRISALPVLDGGGVCGIITQTDVLLAFPAATREAERPAAAPTAPQRRILVPLDQMGHNAAVLAAARELARKAPAIVRLMHVSPEPEPVVVDGRTVSYSDQEAARVEHEVMGELRAAAAELKDIPVEYSVRLGSPAVEIVREAEQVNADLIVMATHKRTGVSRLIHGSVAEDVERTTKLPVLLVPYDGEPEGLE